MATPTDSDGEDPDTRDVHSRKLLSLQQIEREIQKTDRRKKQLEFNLSQHLDSSAVHPKNVTPSIPSYTGAYLWRSPLPARRAPRPRHSLSEDIDLEPDASADGARHHRDATPHLAAAEAAATHSPDGHPPGDHHPANPGEGTIAAVLREMYIQRQENSAHMERMFSLMASSQQARHTFDAIPQCPPMTHKEDIAEYLQVFEDTQKARANPKENWPYVLVPLLNKACRAAILDMPADRKSKYEYLKAELL